MNSLNPLFVLLLVYLLVVYRSTVQVTVGDWLRRWDILLPVIVYLGQRRRILEGLILTFLAGHLYSLCSSAPIGVYAIYYLVIFALARITSVFFFASTWASILVLILALTAVGRVVLVCLASGFGFPWAFWDTFLGFFGGAFWNSLLGLLTYLVLAWLDRFTFKAPRSSIESAEVSI